MTALSVKEVNRRQIYGALYQAGQLNKAELTDRVQVSLATVDSNLKALLKEGLVHKEGFASSTGGRKAQYYAINPVYRVSLGLGVLRRNLHIVAVDLQGQSIGLESFELPFVNTKAYFSQVADYVRAFLHRHQLAEDKILGLNIAIQGLTDPEGQQLRFGNLLGIGPEGLSVSSFNEATGFDSRLCHDSSAAAFYERWTHPEVRQAAFFLLNRNMGGALIIGGKVIHGEHGSAGVIEHMCLNQDGPVCYCGSRGCLETYCSANSLLARAGCSLGEFFEKVRSKDNAACLLWQDYLEHLAQAISNVNILVDGKVIISGYLLPYLNQEDVHTLCRLAQRNNIFTLKEENIITGNKGDYTPAMGAALSVTARWLKEEFSLDPLA